MKKKIIIKNGFGVYENSEEFVMTKNEDLEIDFENLTFVGQAFLIGVIRNQTFILQIKDNSVTITGEHIKAGVLKTYIEIRNNDIATDKIVIDNLTISKIMPNFEAVPEIKECRDEVTYLREKVEKLTKLTEELTDTLMSLLQRQIGD